MTRSSDHEEVFREGLQALEAAGKDAQTANFQNYEYPIDALAAGLITLALEGEYGLEPDRRTRLMRDASPFWRKTPTHPVKFYDGIDPAAWETAAKGTDLSVNFTAEKLRAVTQSGDKVLDIGGGTGRLEEAMRYQTHDLIFADSFDGMVSNGFVQYLSNPQLKHLFAEAQRVLRPGGHLLFNHIPLSGENGWNYFETSVALLR